MGRATDPEHDQNRSTSTSTSTATYIVIAALLVVASAVFFYTYTATVPDQGDVSQDGGALIDPATTAAVSILSLADATKAAEAAASTLSDRQRAFTLVNDDLKLSIRGNVEPTGAFARKISATRDLVVATSNVNSAKKTFDTANAYLQSSRGISQTSRASTSDTTLPALVGARAELAAADQAYKNALLAYDAAVTSLAEATKKADAIANKLEAVILAVTALAEAEVAKSSADDRAVSAAQSVAAAARAEADVAVKTNSGDATAKLDAAAKAEEEAAELEAKLKAAEAARLAAAANTTPSAATPANTTPAVDPTTTPPAEQKEEWTTDDDAREGIRSESMTSNAKLLSMQDEVSKQAAKQRLSDGIYTLFVQLANAKESDGSDLGDGKVGGTVYTFRVRVRTATSVSHEIEVTLLYPFRYTQPIVWSIRIPEKKKNPTSGVPLVPPFLDKS